MDKTLITSESAPTGGPYSPCLVVDGWVFLAGQTGAGDTIEDQVVDVLRKITILLGEAGCTLDDVISCQA
jgi:enamine deaminase RidA (YjgF/YER057c/UK114 family)